MPRSERFFVGDDFAHLHLVDATHPDRDDDVMQQVEARIGRGVPVLTVLNKIDLTAEPARTAFDEPLAAVERQVVGGFHG